MATVTETVLSTVTRALSSSASPTSTATSGQRVAAQAGIFEGLNPVVWNPKDPVILFIIQAGIIIIFCRLLYYPLKYFGQPRVIAEVIGGILLGPSVMMRIPGFKAAIFPGDAQPVLANVANLGLILFLFLTGLEVDIRLFLRDWKVAASVGLAGMILPFGLGWAIAYGLYHQFQNEPGTQLQGISFGVFALFIGTALAITAFPVLCRILTELKLLSTGVGVTVLAAGVGNDVIGWILLALCVSLVNNANGLAALYALLTCIAWILFLVFAVRPAFIYLLRRTGSLHNGPSQGIITITLLMVLTSAWFTGIIGVHPIFGAFLVGTICPHESGFAIKLTEKIEDFVMVLFLPLYFALSGLSTNLGALNDGITWAYVIAVIVIAFAGKIIGGTVAARFCKLVWRESLTIGVLMSCKGLVEIIVLNIGFQANILSEKTFTMFVVMALVTTVSTTPLTKLLYPPWYQHKLEKWKRGEIDWEGNPLKGPGSEGDSSVDRLNQTNVRRLLVYLRLDSLPSLFTFVSLLGEETAVKQLPTIQESNEKDEGTPNDGRSPDSPTGPKPLEVHGVRILELTERTSSVMQVTEGLEYSQRDPVVNTFKTFSQLNNVAVSGHVSVVPIDSYAETLMQQASDVAADFALIPWSEHGSVTEDQSVPYHHSSQDRFTSRNHLDFVQSALAKAVCNTGIFINNGFGGTPRSDPDSTKPALSRNISSISLRSHREPPTMPITDKSHAVFMPYIGGADDRVALRFVLQLAKSRNVTVRVAHLIFAEHDDDHVATPATPAPVHTDSNPTSPTSPRASRTRLPSLVRKEVEEVTAQDLAMLSTLKQSSSLPAELAGRVSLVEVSASGKPAAVLAEVLKAASAVVGQTPRNSGDIVVVGRRHAKLGDAVAEVASPAVGSSSGGAGDMRRTVGVLAEHLVASHARASVLVVQAGGKGAE